MASPAVSGAGVFAKMIERGIFATMGRRQRSLRVVAGSMRSAPANALTVIHRSPHRAIWAGIAVAAGACLLFYAAYYGVPNARSAAVHEARAIAEQEDGVFCEKYGRPFGTRAVTACLGDLMNIRANERQRTLDEFGTFGGLTRSSVPNSKMHQKLNLPGSDHS